MKTTLNKIHAHRPCVNGWKKLLMNLGKSEADDEPLDIRIILESNGLDDALWCLRAVDGQDKYIRLFAVECARSVQHLMTDPRSVSAIDVAEHHAHGLATDEELFVARDAAWAARAAAGAATRAVAWDARAAAGAAQANLLCLFCELAEGDAALAARPGGEHD